MTTFRTHIERSVPLAASNVMRQAVGLGYSNDDPANLDNWRLIVELDIQPDGGGAPEPAVFALNEAQAQTLISCLQHQLGEFDRRVRRRNEGQA